MDTPEDQATKQRTVNGGFRMTIQLTQQRTLEITGYVFNDDTQHAIDQRLDTAREALDRQLIAADVINKEAQNAQIMIGIEQMAEQTEALIKKKNSVKQTGRGLSSQEKTHLENAEQHVATMRKQFESNAAAIAAGRAKMKLNGASPPAA